MRKLIHKAETAWQFVSGQMVPAEAVERFLIGCCAGFEDHGSSDDLPPFRIRHTNHHRIEHVWVLSEHLLDFDRVDVLAAADDQVTAALDDEEIAILVQIADVARVKLAVCVVFSGWLRDCRSSPA